MVVGLTGIVMSSIISMLQISAKQQLQATLTFQAQQIEKNLVKLLNDPNAWKYTFAANAANGSTYMACIQNNQPCTTSGQEPINGGVAVGTGATTDHPELGAPIYKIMDQTNLQVYDLTANTTGFAPTGKSCATWVDAPGVPTNNNCPLKFKITWMAKCNGAGGSCVSPVVHIFIRAWYNPDPKLRVTFNAANYSTDFYQGSDGSQACDWGWSVTKNQLTEVCAPFVGVGVDAVTHLNTRMEVFGTQKIYGFGAAGNTDGDNAVYLNTPTLDAGKSGIAIGFGNSHNGANMGGTGYVSAETQGGQYRNLVLNPLANPGATGFVGIGTTAPYGALDVTVDGNHKLLMRGAVGVGDSASISAVAMDGVTWKPLALVGSYAALYATNGTNMSYGNFGVQGSETVYGNQTTTGSGQINGNLVVSNNIFVGSLGHWMTDWFNQPVKSTDAPSFAGLTVNGNENIAGSLGIGGGLNVNNGPTTLNNGGLSMPNGDVNVNNGNVNINGNGKYLNVNSGYLHVAQPGGSQRLEYLPAGTGRLMLWTASNVTGYVQTDGGTNVAMALANGSGQVGTTTHSDFQIYTNNSPRLEVYADGGLHAKNPGNGNWTLYVENQFYADQVWSPAPVHISSDERLKKDISPLNDSLNRILKLKGVSYRLKTDDKSDHVKDGFIAQDLRQVFPELVDIDKKGFFAVTYEGLIAPIVEAIKVLSSKIEALTAKVEKLITEQSELANENAQLKIDNAAMRSRLDNLEAKINKK